MVRRAVTTSGDPPSATRYRRLVPFVRDARGTCSHKAHVSALSSLSPGARHTEETLRAIRIYGLKKSTRASATQRREPQGRGVGRVKSLTKRCTSIERRAELVICRSCDFGYIFAVYVAPGAHNEPSLPPKPWKTLFRHANGTFPWLPVLALVRLYRFPFAGPAVSSRCTGR